MPGRTLLSILDCKKILTLSLRGPTIRETAFELQRNKKNNMFLPEKSGKLWHNKKNWAHAKD